MKNEVILGSAYLAPVEYYTKLFAYPSVRVESYDHYMKQTYRNRCVIASADGPLALTIPTEKSDDLKCVMKDVRISDHGNWRHVHWNAFVAAYKHSPFFDYYADEFHRFFEQKYEFLFDFNLVPRKMNDIDVDEIETFSILKDAAATAVYGAEGANGVVLITSKRGKSQKTVINMSAEYGYSTPLRLPNLMSSYDYLSLYNEADWNSNGNPRANYTAPVSDADLEKYRTGADPDLYPDANWMNMLRDHTSSQRYTINFRGGGDRVRFFVSGAYYTQDGVYKEKKNADYDSNISFKRYNLRSNIDFELSKTTRMSVDMSGQYINRVAPSKTASDIFGGMTLQPVHLYPQIYSDGSASQHPNYDNSGLRQNPYNFLYFSGYSKSWDATFQSKVLLEQDLDFITKGLSVKGSVSFDANSNQYINRTMSPATFTATGRDANGNLIFKALEAGSALSNPSSGASAHCKCISFPHFSHLQ